METPPATERRVVTDVLHGDEISDPYRWLEETDEEVDEWIDRQNEYTDNHLYSELRDALHPRFEPLAQVATYYPIHVRGDQYFQRVEAPDEDHPVLYVSGSPGGDRRTLVDPNDWNDNRSLPWYVPSIDGAHVAYGVTEGGDEQYDIRVLDVETREIITEISAVGRSGPSMFAWNEDGFYYVATGDASEGKQLEKEIRYHAFDGLERVIEEETNPHVWPVLWTDRETGTLVMGRSEMSGGTDLYVFDSEDEEFVPAITDTDATFAVHLHEQVVYLQTDYDAPCGRVLVCSLDEMCNGNISPDDLDEIVPEQEGTLEAIAVAEDRLVTHHQRNAHSRITVYDLDGDRQHDLPLLDYASTAALTANPDAPECFYTIQSFDRPPAMVYGNLIDGTTRILDETDIEIEADLVVKQEWIESTDGAEVPVFICHRADLERDGDNPAVLYGYGGFRANLTPTFDRFQLPFLTDGGVYAQVCARGGREFGEEWHEAGMLENKQHTFDDFIGATAHLLEYGYTNSDRLAVLGGSNGGLSVGAVITQRPDLFGAAVSAVPLLDMLRFHRFLLGESWTTEYGSPEDEDAYQFIREYSPYHNVEERAYPAVLFTTAARDTRVHPSHARKMTALMQSKSTGGPTLLRTNNDTGHGLGKPTSMILEEQLDQWTFLYDQLSL
jgi:prolyl oligopeptidase